jgi:hypothetical protein
MAVMEDPEVKAAKGNGPDATLQQFGYEQGSCDEQLSIERRHVYRRYTNCAVELTRSFGFVGMLGFSFSIVSW